jgi:hypothetical protein
MNYEQLIQLLTPVIVPAVLALEAKVIAKIPSWLKPIIATLIGVSIDVLNHFLTGHPFSPGIGAILGAAGVGVREIIDQTKQQLSGPSNQSVSSVPPKP